MGCNNCLTCDYKEMRSPGDDSPQHCYMFREEPDDVCMQHTGRKDQHRLWEIGMRTIIQAHRTAAKGPHHAERE